MILYLFITAGVLCLVCYLYSYEGQKLVKVKDLMYYPVRACKGIHLLSTELGLTGLPRNNQWVITTQSLEPISCEIDPRLLLIQPSFTFNEHGVPEALILQYKSTERVHIQLHTTNQETVQLLTENYVETCVDQGEVPAEWFERTLNCHYRLLRVLERRPQSCSEELSEHREGTLKIAVVESFYEVFKNVPGNVLAENQILKHRPHIILKAYDPVQLLAWRSLTINSVRLEVVGLWHLANNVSKLPAPEDHKHQRALLLRHQGVLGVLVQLSASGVVSLNSAVSVSQFK